MSPEMGKENVCRENFCRVTKKKTKKERKQRA